jgi:hypothetical protein
MPPFSRLFPYAYALCFVPAFPLALFMELTNRFDSIGWWYTVLSAFFIALPLALLVSASLTVAGRWFPTSGAGVLRVVCACASVGFGLLAAWSLLWVYSSASLACVPCDCSYSLFAVQPRCRQPSVALLTCVASFGAAALAFVLASRSK